MLPIDSLLPSIIASLRQTTNLVIEAPPGAGKTTRVPPALLQAGFSEVLVLEPRRLAARLAARRVADELREKIGETVGYQVRFEEVGGPKTRLRFLTEGVLTRRLLSDPTLRRVQVVILDEFHERHLDGDLALALLLLLQRTHRPDLRIVVMSATLDAAPIAAHLGNCPILRSEGKLFPLEVEYTPHTGAPLDQMVAGAVEGLARRGLTGSVLVFLPGIAEMRRAARLLTAYPTFLLHGDLSPEEQDRVLLPSKESKIILSTNVAESSITIPGVTAVVDSGLARVAVDSPWTGMPSIEIARISQASAAQRAGRAARTAPGRVVRLFPQEEFIRRHPQDTPEITRRELSQLLINLHGCGIRDATALPWLTPPAPAALQAAESLLERLGVVREGRLTPLGERIAPWPVHPRLGRLIHDGGEDGCRAAAVLSNGDRLEGRPPHLADSDLFLLLERPWPPPTIRTFEQLRRVARPARKDDTALLQAVTAAFSDRLGRRRPNGEILLANGGAATLAESSGVRQAELIVAVDIENRGSTPLIRIASKVEPEWLLDQFPERLESRDGVEWNRNSERVERVSALLFDGLTIEETRSGDPDPEQAAQLLAAKAVEAGIDRFGDLTGLLARWRFAEQYGAPPVPDLAQTIATACYGLRSFAELKALLADGGLERILLESLPPANRSRFDQYAPERIKLASGRFARVHYVDGRPPYVASRLQDFFGLVETPRIAQGQVPLVVHLLAPNQRPVQVTQDLAGFWQRHYPALRRELGRRYPRHAWPENPV